MRLKKPLLLRFLLLTLPTIALNAQIVNNIVNPSLTKYSLAEKIHLQIDNALYQTGETIWFNTVVSKSYDNSLSDLSEIIYVELIDSKKNVLEQKKIKLNQGIGNGSFNLQESYKTGKYVIRAYTLWNRNFENDFIFSQAINVFNLKTENPLINPIKNIVVSNGENKILTADIDPRIISSKHSEKLKLFIYTELYKDSVELIKDKNNIYKLDYKLQKNSYRVKLEFQVESSKRLFEIDTEDTYSKTVIIDENYLNVQFFPESGYLVNGLLSTIGFKAVDFSGLGFQVSGNIKNNEGDIVTTFASNKLGLGTFKLIPESGKNYYAEINKSEVVYTYDLPKAKNTGSILTLANLKNEIRLSIASSNSNKKKIRVETESRGVKYHMFNLELEEKVFSSIPSASLPEGIIKVKVYNDKNQIMAERLFFNNRPDKRISVRVISDQESYEQREKVNLTIKLGSLKKLDTTNMSVLVLNQDKQESSEKVKPNILAQLLLSSELKGFIEHPNFYFDPKNKTRTLDLDALMLTQGWRTYKYQKIIPNTSYKYQAEKNLMVTGTIGEYFNPAKKPRKPLDINMIVYGEPADIYNQEIDSKGKFRFSINDIYKPKTEVFMQVVDKSGKPVDFTINMDKKWVPKINTQKSYDILFPEQTVSKFIEETKTTNKKQQDYEVLYNTIDLEEVELRDYKLTPARQEFINLHGVPDQVIDGKELNEKAPDWNYGIFSVLMSKFQDEVTIVREGPTITDQFLWAKVKNYDFTYVLIDNIPVIIDDYRYIGNLPVEYVKSIDILKNPKDKNKYSSEVLNCTNCPQRVAIINIYTHSGNGLYGNNKSKGSFINEVEGFSESIDFYSPTYETLSVQDWAVPDNRSIIYWSPNIQLNNKGEYILEFYNDDHIGNVSVIVEAISKDGKIGYLEKSYTVKKAE